MRAEQCIKAYPDLRLTQHQPEQVTTYLTKVGQNPRRLDWQYSQTINAIQNLFILVKSSWVNEFEGAFWIQLSESLPTNHATKRPQRIQRPQRGGCLSLFRKFSRQA